MPSTPQSPQDPSHHASGRSFTFRRRSALAGLLASACALLSGGCSGPQKTAGSGEQKPSGSASDKALDEELAQYLRRIEERDYSQQGIPMLLACQNVATSPHTRDEALVARPENAALVARFRRLAKAMPRVRANLKESDTAKLVEILAVEDIARGGKVNTP